MAVVATLHPADHNHPRIEITDRYLSGFAIVNTIIKESEVATGKYLNGFLEINAPICKGLDSLGRVISDFHCVYCSYIKHHVKPDEPTNASATNKVMTQND